eukprot:TRINITY_DN9502_c1_g1_i1.p1 TRINITY_DN9502_c1_g1~~TRINITY_DN9502_c1_g1_i1.p1  ORF type:complete len:938 (-),score=90.42 TRINITY_DN9502_c1_g1_i1:39-2852(-)
MMRMSLSALEVYYSPVGVPFIEYEAVDNDAAQYLYRNHSTTTEAHIPIRLVKTRKNKRNCHNSLDSGSVVNAKKRRQRSNQKARTLRREAIESDIHRLDWAHRLHTTGGAIAEAGTTHTLEMHYKPAEPNAPTKKHSQSQHYKLETEQWQTQMAAPLWLSVEWRYPMRYPYERPVVTCVAAHPLLLPLSEQGGIVRCLIDEQFDRVCGAGITEGVHCGEVIVDALRIVNGWLYAAGPLVKRTDLFPPPETTDVTTTTTTTAAAPTTSTQLKLPKMRKPPKGREAKAKDKKDKGKDRATDLEDYVFGFDGLLDDDEDDLLGFMCDDEEEEIDFLKPLLTRSTSNTLAQLCIFNIARYLPYYESLEGMPLQIRDKVMRHVFEYYPLDQTRLKLLLSPTETQFVHLMSAQGKNVDNQTLQAISTCLELKELSVPHANAIVNRGLSVVTSQCHHLTSIDLSYCTKLTDSVIEDLAVGCPLLVHINLNWVAGLFGTHFGMLASRCMQLATFKVAGCESLPPDPVLDVLTSARNLTYLDASHCGGKLRYFHAESRPKIHAKNLEYLFFHNTRWISEAVFDLFVCEKLRTVGFSQNKFLKNNTLAKFISTHRKIESLDISSTGVIVQPLTLAPTTLLKLDVSCVRDADEPNVILEESLGAVLRACPYLQVLNASGARLSQSILTSIFDYGHNLQELYLNDCGLSEHKKDTTYRIMPVANTARPLLKLRRLFMRKCKWLNEYILRDIIVKTCPRIKALNVSHCNLSNVAVNDLLYSLPLLEALTASYLKWHTSGTVPFTCPYLPRLKLLRIASAKMAKEDFEQFPEKLPNLEVLSLADTKHCSPELLQLFTTHCKHLRKINIAHVDNASHGSRFWDPILASQSISEVVISSGMHNMHLRHFWLSHPEFKARIRVIQPNRKGTAGTSRYSSSSDVDDLWDSLGLFD